MDVTQQLEAELKQITDSANEFRKDMARKAFASVVEKSPVKTGSYVSSHRVGIKASAANISRGRPFESTSINQQQNFKGLTKQQHTAVKQDALKNMAKINKAKLTDVIVIANNIFYADRVEYLGWERTPPYHVYGRTIAELEVQIPFLVKGMRIK